MFPEGLCWFWCSGTPLQLIGQYNGIWFATRFAPWSLISGWRIIRNYSPRSLTYFRGQNSGESTCNKKPPHSVRDPWQGTISSETAWQPVRHVFQPEAEFQRISAQHEGALKTRVVEHRGQSRPQEHLVSEPLG